MTSINFKKLVLRKDLPLIRSLVEATDPNASIHTCEGIRLIGKEAEGSHHGKETGDSHHEGSHHYDVELDGQSLGWVQGNEKAEAIATLLISLARKEQEKRALATELLGKYKEISLLFHLSEKILGSLSVREAAEVALEEAQQLLNAQSGVLFLRQDHSNLLEKVAAFGQENLFGHTITLDTSVIGTIVQTGRGEIVNNRQGDSGAQISAELDIEAGIEPRAQLGDSLICVPLKNKASILGAIALTRPTDTPYTAQDLKIVTTLACQAAGVINALLHEDKLKESRQNDLVLRLSSQIHESLELDEILETTVSEIYTALHLDRCVFLWCEADATTHLLAQANKLISEKTGLVKEDTLVQEDIETRNPRKVGIEKGGIEIVTESKRPYLASMKGRYSPALGKQVARCFRQHRQPLRINDVAQIQDSTTRHFLQSRNISTLIAIPIQTRSGQIGAICCGSSQATRDWNDSEVTLLQAVTNQLAIALDQAELYDQARTAAQTAQDKAQQLESTIAELQQAQLQLVQSEKMSSIGQMVAGVAHEVNNPVSFIHGNLKHLKTYAADLIHLIQQYQIEHSTPSAALQADIDDIDLDFLLEDLPKVLNSMAVGTERIREIVLSLRNFSRLDQSAFKSVDIHEGLDSTLLILSHRLKGTDDFSPISIVKNYQDLPLIECYPGQLNQVFMNVLVNGIDALEAANIHQPRITIQTQKIGHNRLQIRIADNGPGISKDIQDKLFDPFFTTKEVGKGTGLGLSISYQIITERHGGSLICQSSPGQGTGFVIEIPIQQNETP